mgnify:FL=1
MIYLKSLGLAFVFYGFVWIVTWLIAGLTAEPTMSDVELAVDVLYTSLYVWFCIAGAFLLLNFKRVKATVHAIAARMVLLWSPIGLGWFFMTTTGVVHFYLIGMFLSSVVFCYEALVLKSRKHNSG